jgi:hypothetical protein
MPAAEKKDKCKHPPCTCMIASGKYCSAECEAMEGTPDIECRCRHAGCANRVP